jgi:hypothetical protein
MNKNTAEDCMGCKASVCGFCVAEELGVNKICKPHQITNPEDLLHTKNTKMDKNCQGCIYSIDGSCDVNLVGDNKDEFPDNANCYDPTLGLD